MSRFATDFWLPCSPERAFAFFGDARNLNRVTPSWFRFEILSPQPIAMAPGTRIDYRLRWRWLSLRWASRVTVWRPGSEFTYEQERGPFRRFRHEHRFTAEAGGVRIADLVDYRLPVAGGPAAPAVARDLRRIFARRARRAVRLLASQEPPAAPSSSLSPVISASSSAIEEAT